MLAIDHGRMLAEGDPREVMAVREVRRSTSGRWRDPARGRRRPSAATATSRRCTLSARVDEGETLGVIGANGAGKSTLLKVDRRRCVPRAGGSASRWTDVGSSRRTRARALGDRARARGPARLPQPDREENLLVGGYRGGAGPWDLERVIELFPMLATSSTGPAGGCPAASSRPWRSGGPDGQPAAAAARRGVARPGADRRRAALRGAAARSARRARRCCSSSRTSARRSRRPTACTACSKGTVALAGRPAELGREQIRRAYFGMD